MAVKVGINGFGRIGRNVFRAALRQSDVAIVAVNDITDNNTLAHLLKHDSVLGTLPEDVKATEAGIQVGDRFLKVFSERDPAQIPWGSVGAEVVVESTGLFTNREDAAKHLRDGVRKVVISAPANGEDMTLVLGVNDDRYDATQHHVISNAFLHNQLSGAGCQGSA